MNIPMAKRAIRRGNVVVIGRKLPESIGIQFNDFAKLKAYVQKNGFHGDCFISPKRKAE